MDVMDVWIQIDIHNILEALSEFIQAEMGWWSLRRLHLMQNWGHGGSTDFRGMHESILNDPDVLAGHPAFRDETLLSDVDVE